MLKKINTKLIGYFFVAIAMYYIINSILSLNIEPDFYLYLLSYQNVFISFLSLALYIIVLYIGAALWIYFLYHFSGIQGLANYSLIKIYAKANLGKYIPGNIMHYVARNVLAKKNALSHTILSIASISEIIFVLVSGVLILLLSLSFISIDIHIEQYLQYISSIYLEIGVGFFLVFIAIVYFYKKIIQGFITRSKLLIPGYHYLLYALIGYICIYLILGLSQLFIMTIFLNIEFGSNDYWNILFAFTFSWLVGYIVPGAPGGIGVREALFIFLLAPIYTKEVVIFVAVFYRLINISGDLLFYFVTNKLFKFQNLG